MIAALFLLAAAAADTTPDPAQVDLLDAITCRLAAPAYNGFAMALDGDENLAAKRGWRKQGSANPFMIEYDLPKPITVAGRYSTSRIGFTADAVVAILDLADPAPLAREEGMVNTLDSNPLIGALVASGKASRDEVESHITFHAFRGEKIVVDQKELPEKGERFGMHTVIVRSIGNATTHPGKAFYGCSYSMEMIDKDGRPL
jgi:hypothetical protein